MLALLRTLTDRGRQHRRRKIPIRCPSYPRLLWADHYQTLLVVEKQSMGDAYERSICSRDKSFLSIVHAVNPSRLGVQGLKHLRHIRSTV